MKMRTRCKVCGSIASTDRSCKVCGSQRHTDAWADVEVPLQATILRLVSQGYSPRQAVKAAMEALTPYYPVLRPAPTVQTATAALNDAQRNVARATASYAKANRRGKRIHGQRVR